MKSSKYVALRIGGHCLQASAPDTQELRRKLDASDRLRNRLWTVVTRAVRKYPDPPHTDLMTTSNSVIDLDPDRRASLRIQVPVIVTVVIMLSCVAWALLASAIPPG